MKNKSEYKAWFIAQFGKRPSKKPVWELKEDYLNSALITFDSRKLFEETKDWDIKYDYCLRTYYARQKTSKGGVRS